MVPPEDKPKNSLQALAKILCNACFSPSMLKEKDLNYYSAQME